MNPLELTGRARTHLVELPEVGCSLHRHVAAPFRALRRAAASAGIDLAPVSAFRDFDRQLAIWNGKFAAMASTPGDRVDAILQWSALPGLSRHHWGTDMDLIDRSSLPAGYRVSLVPAEYGPGGPFAALAAWLDSHASRHGFFRPYRGVRSGVQAEPWHFSFAPTAEAARRRLRPGLLAEVLEACPLAGGEIVRARLVEIHARYHDAFDLP